MINKTKNGWLLDFRPGGRNSKRIRKTFPTKSEAQRYKTWATNQCNEGKPWNIERDNRRLSELIQLWFQLHGTSLRSGYRRKGELERLSQRLSDPLGPENTKAEFLTYRTKALETGTPASTLNHYLAYLRAIYNELLRLGKWKGDNPFKDVRRLPVDQLELNYLDIDQIIQVLEECDNSSNPDTGKVARICLATGTRWSEAELIERSQVRPGRLILKSETSKNRKIRVIPIDDCIQ